MFTHAVTEVLEGGFTEMASIFADQYSTLVKRVQMWGEGGVSRSQPSSTAVHITRQGAQINFGDLHI